MAKPKRILYPVIFMMIITGIYTTVLASINALAKDRIETQEMLRLESAVLYTNDMLSEKEDIHSAFISHFIEVDGDTGTYYVLKTNDQIESYTFPFQGKALWGTVDGLITFNDDFTQILGVDFLKHSETPGLGGRIEEEWYKSQFRGIQITSPPYLSYQSGQSGNIDAITGATLTSNAIRDMLNTFIQEIKTKAEGGEFNE